MRGSVSWSCHCSGSLDCEQNLGSDLAETVEDPLRAKVRRTRTTRSHRGCVASMKMMVSACSAEAGPGRFRYSAADNACTVRETRRRLRRSSCDGAPCPRPEHHRGVVVGRRSRFSAKFNRASGNHFAPGILSPSTRTRSPRVSATTPQKSQTAVQNCSVHGPTSRRLLRIPDPAFQRWLTRWIKRVMLDLATRSLDGRQSKVGCFGSWPWKSNPLFASLR